MFGKKKIKTEQEIHQEILDKSTEDGRDYTFDEQDTRAVIATHALQGILANPEFYGPLMQGDTAAAADKAVQAAESLLYFLRKTYKE